LQPWGWITLDMSHLPNLAIQSPNLWSFKSTLRPQPCHI
jgi:hypothetical protein